MSAIRVSLPPDGDVAPSVARRYVRDVCARWDEDMVGSVLLATSELVTNAVVHGGDPVTLVVHSCARAVRVEVHDGGATPPSWLLPGGPAPSGVLGPDSDDELALGGRGLHIVDALAERWGVTQRPPGKAVWFELGPAQVERWSRRADDGSPAPAVVDLTSADLVDRLCRCAARPARSGHEPVPGTGWR